LEAENKSAETCSSKGARQGPEQVEDNSSFHFSPFSLRLFWILTRAEKDRNLADKRLQRWGNMNVQLPLEEKHVLLKHELCRNLEKKQELESKINKQFEELKKLEISLERRSSLTAEV